MRHSLIFALIVLLSAPSIAWAGPAVSTGTGNERISRGCLPEATQSDPPALTAEGEHEDEQENYMPETLHQMVNRRDCKSADY